MRQSIPPEIFEPIGRQLSITDYVLDVLVPHPGLDGPGIVAGVRQGVAAATAEQIDTRSTTSRNLEFRK